MMYKRRPKTGFVRSMQVQLEKDSLPMVTRVSYNRSLSSHKPIEICDENPQTVYNWLDQFELALKDQGKSYEYPVSKFMRSREIATSEGYRQNISRPKKLVREKTEKSMPSTAFQRWRKQYIQRYS